MKKILIPFLLFMFIVPIAALADGQADFKANCLMCHGGGTRANHRRAQAFKVDPKKLNLTVSKMNKEEMIAIVNQGKGKMPDFAKKLTKGQIMDIVDYVLSLKKK